MSGVRQQVHHQLFDTDRARAQTYAAAEKAEATRTAYRSDGRLFADWCASHGLTPLLTAAETVAAFLAHEVDRGTKPATIARRLRRRSGTLIPRQP
jgi:site-specific recombinase XerD